MKKTFLVSFLLTCTLCAYAQSSYRLPAYESGKIDSKWLYGTWDASWVLTPETDLEFGVYHFRKTIALASKPEQFVVHVSADNRYKLYVNGSLVSLGPAEGNPENWRFETVDLAPWLEAGDNILAADVWNFADFRPVGILSGNRCAFILQGNSELESAANTGTAWKCMKDKSYSPLECPRNICNYAIGCGERFDSRQYPWNWRSVDFDDSDWSSAIEYARGCTKIGGLDNPEWQLVPRSIPQMRLEEVGGVELVGSGASGAVAAGAGLVIPAGTEKTMIFDKKNISICYPRLSFSGGKDAVINMGYAESLYEDSQYKGDRNATEGKNFIGYSDEITADGASSRSYEPLFWRACRYIVLTVKTADEPLTIDGLNVVKSQYPVDLASTFSAPGHEDLEKMLEIGWRTSNVCMQEVFMSDAYYEELQYFGDSRLHALTSLVNTRDLYLHRNLLESGRESMLCEGITQSRYPSRFHQFIPPYALIWILTAHDHWMYRGDEAYLKSLVPTFRSVLDWFGQYQAEDHTLRNVPFWNFVDWADFPMGTMYGDGEGRTAYLDILYMMALNACSEMEGAFGSSARSSEYEAEASAIKSSFRQLYWSSDKKMFADNPDLDRFSQHINSLAIVSGISEGEEARDLMMRIVDNKDINQCTIYFRFYLQWAMKKSGCGNLLLDRLQILRDQMALGLTTWAEQPEPSRSDCHPWGASPNIEFFRTVLGIEPSSPGFATVSIAPALGSLKAVSGSMPHPSGEISVEYRLVMKNRLEATITLPEGVTGTFHWKGSAIPLSPGTQVIKL